MKDKNFNLAYKNIVDQFSRATNHVTNAHTLSGGENLARVWQEITDYKIPANQNIFKNVINLHNYIEPRVNQLKLLEETKGSLGLMAQLLYTTMERFMFDLDMFITDMKNSVIEHNQVEYIDDLVGENVDTIDAEGSTMLLKATAKHISNTEIIDKLLDLGADPMKPCLYGTSPLSRAIGDCNIVLITKYLSYKLEHIDHNTNSDYTQDFEELLSKTNLDEFYKELAHFLSQEKIDELLGINQDNALTFFESIRLVYDGFGRDIEELELPRFLLGERSEGDV